MFDTIISVAILILSVVIHELSHGLMADRLGDPTARHAGRLTMNPLKHLDPIGSVLVPLLTSFAGFIVGWAKPVPYNPYNLHNKRSGEFLIALAGPASNIIIATIFGLVLRNMGLNFNDALVFVIVTIVYINIILAIFNLIPIPPLDGSKLLFSLLPEQYGKLRMIAEANGPIFLFVALFIMWQVIPPIINLAFKFITGFSL